LRSSEKLNGFVVNGACLNMEKLGLTKFYRRLRVSSEVIKEEKICRSDGNACRDIIEAGFCNL